MLDQNQLAIEYAHNHRTQFLETLNHLLRIPSISTDPDHLGDMVAAAEWLANYLRTINIARVEILSTNGNPVVFAEHTVNQDLPTILIYGHYDVQPVEPLELWESRPFDPQVRGENLYARGASDMKGQVMASIYSIEAIMKIGSLPVNLKFLIEGEEEIGSPNLTAFIEEHCDLLACDLALNPDTGMLAPDVPTLTYALRGLSYFELRVYGPSHDLHSGIFGGVVHNPAQALCELVAGMHDQNGRITLPGFYDRVLHLDDEERNALARLPESEENYIRQTGVPALWGESEFTATERIGARPTLEVNGLLSGFTGSGSKTVIPAWAMAKISCRLVPYQDPEEVHQQLKNYLEEHAPKTIRWELTKMAGGPAGLIDRHGKGTQAMAKSLAQIWGKEPVYIREGGSVPVVTDLQNLLNADSVLTGFGLPDDHVHSPNERLNLPTWYKGIDALIHFFYNYGES